MSAVLPGVYIEPVAPIMAGLQAAQAADELALKDVTKAAAKARADSAAAAQALETAEARVVEAERTAKTVQASQGDLVLAGKVEMVNAAATMAVAIGTIDAVKAVVASARRNLLRAQAAENTAAENLYRGQFQQLEQRYQSHIDAAQKLCGELRERAERPINK